MGWADEILSLAKSLALPDLGGAGMLRGMHIGKINVVALLAALGLFFVPWIEVQCSGPGAESRALMTQSGFQAATGNMTISQDLRSKQGFLGEQPTSGGDVVQAWLVLASAGVAVLALLVAFGSIGEPQGSKVVSLLALVALGLVLGQTVLGFPLEQDLKVQLEKDKTKSGDGADAMKAAFRTNMNDLIKIKMLPALYGYFAALGVAGLLGFLVSSRDQQKSPWNP